MATAKPEEPLSGREILLGVCGSIAAYKAVEVLRQLTHLGAGVSVVMSEHAQRFIAPLTFQVLSRRPVLTDLFAPQGLDDIEHVYLARGVHLVVVAPATANLIGKMANGIADDFLSTVLVATQAPVVLAPAMDAQMYANVVVQENLDRLLKRGVEVIEPEWGELASGRMGMGRLAGMEHIVERVVQRLYAPKDLSGHTVLVTAGPTVEPVDAVRFLSNPSSGKMGYGLAIAARRRGAEVTLVSGPTYLPDPWGVRVVRVGTAAEMRQAVLANLGEANVVLMAAAVSDFRPAHPRPGKIKKGEMGRSLPLEPTDDILAELGAEGKGAGGRRVEAGIGKRVVVGFAAETEELVANACKKLRQKHLDLVVANAVDGPEGAFGSETNQVVLIGGDGKAETLPRMAKGEVATVILDRVVQLLGNRRGAKEMAGQVRQKHVEED